MPQPALDLGWDGVGRLLTAAVPGGAESAFSYDGEGRRSQVESAGTVVDIQHAADTPVAAYDGSGELLARWIPGPDSGAPLVVYLYDGAGSFEGRLWLYTDHRGSVVAEADDSGMATAVHTYGPFGETRRGHGPGAHLPPLDPRQPFRFTGQMWDPATGLSFHNARYYSPALGRFVSPDPAGYADGLNLYAYAGNDPVNLVDPTGLAMERANVALEEFCVVCPAHAQGRGGRSGSSARLTPMQQQRVDMLRLAESRLRELDPTNRELSSATGPNYVPTNAHIARVQAEIRRQQGAGSGARALPPAHSVVFETTIARTGAGTREAHKALANRDLAKAMSNKEFAQMLSPLGVKPVSGSGTPAGFRWHHAPDRPGVMQLVPESQHTPGSIFWDVLHPGGSGGFARWGRGW